MKDNLPIIPFASQEAWESWLAQEHATSPGLWLKIAKKDSGITSISHTEALEVALCYGWIDGQRDKFDDSYFLQRFTPRRPRSKWSKVNCAKVEELITRGAMQPAGMHQVTQAKADGRWDAAYASQSIATIPDDLRQELEQNDQAREFFESLSSANRYAILYRLHDAKKPETRARRLAQFITMLNEGKTLHP